MQWWQEGMQHLVMTATGPCRVCDMELRVVVNCALRLQQIASMHMTLIAEAAAVAAAVVAARFHLSQCAAATATDHTRCYCLSAVNTSNCARRSYQVTCWPVEFDWQHSAPVCRRWRHLWRHYDATVRSRGREKDGQRQTKNAMLLFSVALMSALAIQHTGASPLRSLIV